MEGGHLQTHVYMSNSRIAVSSVHISYSAIVNHLYHLNLFIGLVTGEMGRKVVKVLVFGRTRSGKTSIINTLDGQRNMAAVGRNDDRESTTKGQ